eukprot:3380811-Pyramimonas_sp.AAC.1
MVVMPARSSSTAAHLPRSASGGPATCPGEPPASFHACFSHESVSGSASGARQGSSPQLSRTDFPSPRFPESSLRARRF